MGNTHITQSVGAVDQLGQLPAQGDGAERVGSSHGDVVVEALSHPVRVLIAGVLLANLALGVWLVARSDFSGLQPQGAADAAQNAATERSAPVQVVDPAPLLTVATANERD